VCTFEFIKPEETTWRDFTIMGDTGTGRNSPIGNDGAMQDFQTLFALQQDLKDPQFGSLIKWSSYIDTGTNASSNDTSVTDSSHKANRNANHGSKLGPFLLFLIMLNNVL
jgi:hypothetical protein